MWYQLFILIEASPDDNSTYGHDLKSHKREFKPAEKMKHNCIVIDCRFHPSVSNCHRDDNVNDCYHIISLYHISQENTLLPHSKDKVQKSECSATDGPLRTSSSISPHTQKGYIYM